MTYTLALKRDVLLAWPTRQASRDKFTDRAQTIDMRGEDVLYAGDSNRG